MGPQETQVKYWYTVLFVQLMCLKEIAKIEQQNTDDGMQNKINYGNYSYYVRTINLYISQFSSIKILLFSRLASSK